MATGWAAFLPSLTAEGPKIKVREAAIVGLEGGVWTSTSGLNNIETEQIRLMAIDDAMNKEAMFQSGVRLGQYRCTLLRHEMENNKQLILQTKGSPSYGVAVTKSNAALVIVIGEQGIKAPELLERAHFTTTHLAERGT